MSRINWFAYAEEVRALLSRHLPEEELRGLGQQYFEGLLSKAIQLAKNLHRGSATGAVGSHTIWAKSMEDLRAQMIAKGYGELFPEEEAICLKAFARSSESHNQPMVLVWHYGKNDLEFEASSEWYYRMSRSGGGGGSCGVPDSSGPSAGNVGIH